MKMQNFTIRGHYLQVIGRIVSRNGKDSAVYDIDFPDGMQNMSLVELQDVVKRLREDIDSLFYSWGQLKDDTIETFEEIWSEKYEDGDADAHGA